MKKPMCSLYGGSPPYEMCTPVFSFIPQGNEKNKKKKQNKKKKKHFLFL